MNKKKICRNINQQNSTLNHKPIGNVQEYTVTLLKLILGGYGDSLEFAAVSLGCYLAFVGSNPC